jgi:hypothetical protein
MLAKISSQACRVAGIDHLYCPAENWIFNAFMVPEIEPIGRRRLLNTSLQSRPTLES